MVFRLDIKILKNQKKDLTQREKSVNICRVKQKLTASPLSNKAKGCLYLGLASYVSSIFGSISIDYLIGIFMRCAFAPAFFDVLF
ncbi:MAG: hypothetical protein RSB38_08300 [Oscillospiraceae bacterium]